MSNLFQKVRERAARSAARMRHSRAILIVMPIYKYPHPQTLVCLDDLVQTFTAKATGEDILIHREIGHTAAYARNGAIRRFEELEQRERVHVEGMLWVDDDMIWPKGMAVDAHGRTTYGFDIINRLRERQKDIVSTLCTTRKPPFRVNCSRILPDKTIPSITDPELIGFSNTELFQMDYTGFGIVWIPRATIIRMVDAYGTKLFDPITDWRNRPEFSDPILAEAMKKGDLEHLKDEIDRIWQYSSYLNEDYAFCQRARRLGLEVWIDPTVEVLHMGDYAYGRRDFMAMYVDENGKFKGYGTDAGERKTVDFVA